ncbi:MAG: Gfo/Idh/MocA family oxidoreductase [Saprospiraceae bacterium]|nr:Gfo/Idh/MocA family oxidoreductase [Saprospiraceae bacterium]
MTNRERKLKVGVLGCGPIAQFTHFESCQKARNIELYAICDRAPDLLERMNAIWQPVKVFSDYQKMLDDPEIEAIIVATADAFHVPLSLQAIEAGKHVLVEKPLSHAVSECIQLKEALERNPVHFQVGHMKRFDQGIQYAKEFISDKMGAILALKAWYGDNTHRYTMTDNLQPVPIKSAQALAPHIHPKADLERYYMMAHGSHLVDTARYLAGPIASVSAKLRQKFGAYCWFVDVEFENGTLGHLDLTIKIRGDWHEGFQVYGENGSVFAKTPNPWFYKSSEVECYWEPEQQYFRPLAADGFSYRLQLEHFAEVILKGVPPTGTNLAEGLEITKTMIAIKRSIREKRSIYLDQINEGEL